jgi:hypothetical protein
MSAPRPLEEALLEPARRFLFRGVACGDQRRSEEAALQLLEATSARLGGYSFDWYIRESPWADRSLPPPHAEAVTKLAGLLHGLAMPPSLALASLAQPELSSSARRSAGVYYTDFRLAEYVVRPLRGVPARGLRVLDPASGTGTLLAAAVLALTPGPGNERSQLIGSGVCGADLSARALRGAALALASLTGDEQAIWSLLANLRKRDSLLGGKSAWEDVAPDGFEVVLGNPPWEKLKVSGHEFLRANGVNRHYGAAYERGPSRDGLAAARQTLDGYVAQLEERYEFQGRGEHDLYKLFLELAVRLTKPAGRLLFLVPAGLIRSLGTRPLRSFLFERCSDVEFTVLENRARFFAIDTRFKFLAVQARIKAGHRRRPIRLTPAVGDREGVRPRGCVRIGRSALAAARPDLSLPEVRSREEWDIFHDIVRRGIRFGDPDGPWRPALMREVDMTRDRRHFCRQETPGTVPLIEGRMVHQFRHAVKGYRLGTGRRAVWTPLDPNEPCHFHPQFYFPLDELPPAVRERASVARVGFCDITGQTNERTMLAARIPAGVVCGNKVPTVVFGGTAPPARMRDCWLALVNSIPFDWLLRRVVTTTVNYFLLLDLPMPDLDLSKEVATRLARLAATLGSCPHDPGGGSLPRGGWEEAEFRARIDWEVLHAYGRGLNTLSTMLEDFPLLDRSQPPIRGERRSTITRDFLLLRTAEGLGEGTPSQVAGWRSRVDAARGASAVPYVPPLATRGKAAKEEYAWKSISGKDASR